MNRACVPLQFHVCWRGVIFQKSLYSCSVVNTVENHMRLGGKGSKQFIDVGIDVFWRIVALARIKEPLVMRHTVAELVYLFELKVELRAVCPGRSRGVKIWNP